VSGTTGTDGGAPLAIGVDGARGGWLAAIAHGDRDDVSRTELRLLPDLDALVALRGEGDAAPVCIDVPIGLPDAQELRACDRAARERLGARRSSVFEPPARTLLDAEDYADARRRLAALPGGRSVSAQAFALLPRIREAVGLLRRDPSAAGWLHECHPEVAFAELTGDALPPKRSVAGAARRLEALRADPDLRDVTDRFAALDAPAKDAALDDALDAYAALWSALRVRRGTAKRLGLGADGAPPRDGVGVAMTIVF
jgi:predicted RNase H-like nuclease